MKNILALSLLAVFACFFFACWETPEEKNKREMDINFQRMIGRSYMESDKLQEAEEAYKNLLGLSPGDASAYANLALVYLKQNKYEAAKGNINKALNNEPDNPDILMILARYFELTQAPDEAIVALEKILKKNPDYAMALYNLAEMFGQSEQPGASNKREQYLKLTIEKAPGNVIPRLDLIALLLKKAAYDDATFQLEELPKIFPEFPKEATGFYDKTMAALHAGATEEAKSSAAMLHNFLKATTQYQAGLRELKGPGGDLAGLSVLALGNLEKMYAQPGESILERIRFLDVSGNVNLDSDGGFGQTPAPTEENSSHFTFGDYNEDGYVDVYTSSAAAGNTPTVKRLLANNFGTRFIDQTEAAGIRHSGRESAALFGDYDNDGHLDLYVVKDGANVLYKNTGSGKFSDVSAAAKVDDPAPGNKPLFLDADHDGDLDLLVTKPGSNILYRNNGDGTFTDMAEAMGLGLPIANCSDAAFGDFDEDGDLDLALPSALNSNLLLSNERHGKFTDITSGSGLQDAKPAAAVEVADYNNDGFVDLLLCSNGPGTVMLYSNQGDGTFKPESAPWLKAIGNIIPRDAAFLDFDNDGFLDLAIVGKPTSDGDKGVFLFHNDGKGNFKDVSDLLPSSVASGQQIEALDYDKDGDLDIFVCDLGGKLHLLQNEGGNLNHYLKLQLVGLRTGNNKNNHFGIGAKIELRAGELYQTKFVTEPNIHFGLGSRLKADVIRVIWTNGVAQNNFFPGTDQELLEAQHLKGSCAFLYTWDGARYVFSKDMMWRSALGMPLGIMGANTAYAPSGPSKEYLKIPGEKMKLQDGQYKIQITEELWETAYFDNLELVVLDHLETEELYVDERFTLPPYSDKYELYTIKKKLSPITALDAYGTNVRPQILEKDDDYLANFQLGAYQGITKTRDLVLEPDKTLSSGNMLLFLNGWIFPSDASINVALGQGDNLKVIPPQLQVLNKKGDWVTVIQNIGFPMGKDKTMIVDLSGKFLSKDRRIRIRTNMEIYWDEIFFASEALPGPMAEARLKPLSADLHYRGFSKLFRKGGRYGPHWFDYYTVSKEQKWRDLIGNYTRFGAVEPLLSKVDDQLVIMNSGDEMTLAFDASKLAPLPAGWKRDFLIYSEGWIKDGDFNTAHGKTVEPLPFHAMTQYPYGNEEAFPSDPEHQEYLKHYNTRTVNTRNFRRELIDLK